MPKKLLLIAKNWPEPNSTAAGRRTLDLVDLLQQANFDIHIASAAEETPFQFPLESLNVTCHKIAVNDDSFDSWISELEPSLVIFDRYVMEEQFGWRVKEQVPNAVTLLDTSDLHCLRLAREYAFKKEQPLDLFSDQAIREITSIARCDLTLMISEIEIDILHKTFGIPKTLLVYLPFLVDSSAVKQSAPYLQREHLMMMGGFKHEPNRDAARWLKETLWPMLTKHLPKHVEMHVYGAYADHAMNQLNNPKQRFFIKGRAENALETYAKYRVNLAPLRFGAGQKGKILEGWISGTPTITTTIGAESMAASDEFGYTPSQRADVFCQQTIKAFEDEIHWQTLQVRGYDILTKRFDKSMHSQRFLNTLLETTENIEAHRHQNFWGRLLWNNQFRASEFMSRWITLKNDKNNS
jgi:hypothetical protein